jgi:hypothetical protein
MRIKGPKRKRLLHYDKILEQNKNLYVPLTINLDPRLLSPSYKVSGFASLESITKLYEKQMKLTEKERDCHEHFRSLKFAVGVK